MTTVKLVLEPTVIPLAEMTLDPKGLEALMDWVRDYRPECLPNDSPQPMDLFPHDATEGDRDLSGNELLVELAGRNCYHSYGAKAGRKTNREYIAHSQSGTVPHRSIMYHAKMTFFIGGISRRVSHELIRHYVGADRTEEGSPSQESTRYTHHPGHFIVPPRILDTSPDAVVQFRQDMEQAYKAYLDEAAAGLLPMQASTSMIWTTNPVALAKLFLERTDSSADAEFQRLAKHWQSIAVGRWPNLFHQG